ncbi:MAG: pentapeptide repeat-containing protein [Gloeomargaritaceae cyanobacterium C42_A2020_066]|nr:pentapeptide repeat-containing protein [Gloeomargaritaceae cyanobacterium C42_A2020_066]
MAENLDPVLGGRVQSSDPVLGGIETLKRALVSEDPQVLSRVVEQLPNYGAEGIDLLIGVVNRETQWEVRVQAWKALKELKDLKGGELPSFPWRDVGGAEGLKERYHRGERDFSFAELSEAYLGGANLSGADLSGADLSWADLRWIKFDESTQLDSKWQLVWEIVNEGATGKNLREADLRGADLRGADLSGAIMPDGSIHP